MSDTKKDELPRGDEVEVHPPEKPEEVLTNKDLMSDAFDGENREHEEGVWEAAKSHPWACMWAFIMCFTIVSQVSPDSSTLPHFSAARWLIDIRN
jgi:MFS transporter, SP family, general alpha glucoside:H+ symporter